jgi:hypothetical protein
MLTCSTPDAYIYIYVPVTTHGLDLLASMLVPDVIQVHYTITTVLPLMYCSAFFSFFVVDPRPHLMYLLCCIWSNPDVNHLRWVIFSVTDRTIRRIIHTIAYQGITYTYLEQGGWERRTTPPSRRCRLWQTSSSSHQQPLGQRSSPLPRIRLVQQKNRSILAWVVLVNLSFVQFTPPVLEDSWTHLLTTSHEDATHQRLPLPWRPR